MDQGLELGFWLGILGLALSSVQILLWRTRHVLNRSRQDAEVPEVKLVPAPVAQQARLMPDVPRREVRRVSSVVHKSA